MEIFLNGRYCAADKAAISAFDRGFLFGDGFFTTLKVERSVPLFLAEHLDRLRASAHFLGIAFPDYPFGEIITVLLKKNGLAHARVKIVITRGSDGLNRLVNYQSHEPTAAVLAFPLPAVAPAAVSLAVSSEVRGDGEWYRHKTTSYLPNLLRRTQARERGADDCIILDWRRQVCETTTANLFFIKNDCIVTPPARLPLLNGIMRQALLARGSLGRYSLREETVAEADLHTIDAAFVTSAVVEICPVSAIDGRALPVTEPRFLREEWMRKRQSFSQP